MNEQTKVDESRLAGAVRWRIEGHSGLVEVWANTSRDAAIAFLEKHPECSLVVVRVGNRRVTFQRETVLPTPFHELRAWATRLDTRDMSEAAVDWANEDSDVVAQFANTSVDVVRLKKLIATAFDAGQRWARSC